jgi:hypothetical protein
MTSEVIYAQENFCEIILIKTTRAAYLGQQHWRCRWAEPGLETCKSWDRADPPQIPARQKSRSAIWPTREQKGGRESPRRWRSRSKRPGSSAGGAAGPRAGRNHGSARYRARSRIPVNHSSQSHRRPLTQKEVMVNEGDPLIMVFKEGFLEFFFSVRYLTLLHLPPLGLQCVGGCWDQTQDRCDYRHRLSDALTTRLDLIR